MPLTLQAEETTTSPPPPPPAATATATATATMDATALAIQELVSIQARGKGTTMLRESYETRVRTFSSLKYFAKPACLSPLLCARLG